jgi:type I restriction enzyme M protein
MVALKGKSDIGDQINKRSSARWKTPTSLRIMPTSTTPPSWPARRWWTAHQPDRHLRSPAWTSPNRADGDDILGDAYEYLMRHFATESGKSKGQFYTPAEVSRVMAKVIGIHNPPTTTVYDPTCGSGSLLLKVAEAAPTPSRSTARRRTSPPAAWRA